jgi:DNA repair protein RecO (recombination protein O)
MAIARDEAIVLGRSRFGETSLIVTLFTRERGPLRFVAKGARKPRSRFGGALEPTNHILAVYYRKEGRDLHLLSQADLLTSFGALRGSLLRLANGYAILESLIGLKREETPADRLFRLALESLGALEKAPEEELETVLWGFLLAALADAGYRPELERCLRCGAALAGSGARFDARAGGALCARHGEGSLVLSAGTVELLGASASGERAPRAPSPREAAEGREALRLFLEEHDLGRAPFRSLDLLARRREGGNP